MHTNHVPRLGRDISAIGLGCWQLGADWGDVADDTATAILDAAYDAGVTFFDTADVYGDGRSERSVGEFRARHPEVFVATKMGRRASPHEASEYTLDNFRAWTDRSRTNLGMDTLDLVQLHCPPTSVYSDPATYDALAVLVDEGRIARWGVSVETCDEALEALRHPGLASIQIIVNLFRRKPLELVTQAAADAGVAIIARVPLASGLLSGKYDEHTQFAANDHRNFNRDGAAFSVGETFSGVPYDVGVAAAREVASYTPSGWSTAQFALGWLTQQPGISTVIPGARTPEQAHANAAAAELPAIASGTLDELEGIYDREIRAHVHDAW
ncbi:aldo/keto reductase [Demequina sp.]|uniref:aldo/keto reductase n=1 Tax=Demequina sp. TaxID=2050685 RepID=UPI003D0B0F7E